MDLPEGYATSSLSRFAGFMTYRFVRLNSVHAHWVRNRNSIHSLSDLHQYWDQSDVVDHYIRLENVEADLKAGLKSGGYSDNDVAFSLPPKQNASRHRATVDYYDEETDALVHKMDRFIIDKFHYQSPLTRAVPAAATSTGGH